QAGRGHLVVSAESVDGQAVTRVGGTQRYSRRKTARGCAGAGAGHGDDIVEGGPVQDHLVGQPVPDRAPRGPGQVQVDLADGRGGQVVDRDFVAPAQGVDVYSFHTAHIHDDVAEVAGELQPRPVGQELKDLVEIGPVEDHPVLAGLALDPVVAVTRVPGECVVPQAEEGDVVPLVPVHRVVSAPSKDRVC